MHSNKYIVVDFLSDKELLKSIHNLGIKGYEFLYNLPRKEWLRTYKVYKIRLYVDFELNTLFDKYKKRLSLNGDYENIEEFKNELDLFNTSKIKLSNSKKRAKIKELEKQIQRIKDSIE